MTTTGSRQDFWDPGAYLRREGPRTRAVLDLIARVNHPGARVVVDLGCGPGNNTELISDHWRDALVVGVDNSAHMIRAAGSRARSGNLDFIQCDLREWEPAEPVDVIVANAVLQWIPGHTSLLPRLAGFLAPGGVLGFQMPRPVLDSVSVGGILADLVSAPPWSDLLPQDIGILSNMAPRSDAVDPAHYLALLANEGLESEVWETSYTCVMDDIDDVVEYAKGGVLRPVLTALPADRVQRFLADYTNRVRVSCPVVTVGSQRFPTLRHRRFFAVAHKP